MIPGVVRIFVCTAPVDLRHGFDQLAQTARERVGTDPMSGGALFVFANKRATRLKVLRFEKNGFCLLYRRLHQAMFELPLPAPALRRYTSMGRHSRSYLRAYRKLKRGREKRNAITRAA